MQRPSRRADAQGSSQNSEQGAGRSGDAAVFYAAGQRHMQAGHYPEALLFCREALEADPDHLEALHLMGLLALRARQYDQAIAWTARANRLDIEADYLHSLGTALEQQGLHQEAFKAFDAGIQLKPADADLRA